MRYGSALPDHTATIQRTGYPMREADEIAACCDHCKQEVYQGELMYDFEGEQLCPDCFRQRIEEMPLEQLAALMMVDTILPGEDADERFSERR